MTTQNICNSVRDLVEYAIRKGLAEESDRVYLTNRIMGELKIGAFEPEDDPAELPALETILSSLCDYAAAQGILPDNSVTQRDLYDTKLMGILTPRPSQVISEFVDLYCESPKKATDYFYRLSCDSDYIRTYRVARDLKWKYAGKYGELDITINLSKPEKDPKAIAAAKLQKSSGYPKCAICRENEGFAGSLTQAARALWCRGVSRCTGCRICPDPRRALLQRR